MWPQHPGRTGANVPTKWQRVTDPKLAEQLYSNGLLYEKHEAYDDYALACDWNPHTEWSYRMHYREWSFYVLLEE